MPICNGPRYPARLSFALTVIFRDLLFALIKFVLIEVPLASYAIDADTTAARVSRFSEWMKANKLAGVAGVVGLFGIVLIVRGVSRLG